jgi:putative two-component system response regulator
MMENEMTQSVAIQALAHLAEIRDPETGAHIQRTQAYVEILARELQHHPRFADTINDRYIRLVTRSAPLHDIGKVGIPDHVLMKPARFNPQEWTVMQTHAFLGANAISNAEQDIGQPIEFLELAKEIAHWHHERWDGTGYPDGLKGEQIPLSARLMAIADVFDALISKRVYKQDMSVEKAREIILEGRGNHFDPDIVDAFIEHFEKFTATAEMIQDKKG